MGPFADQFIDCIGIGVSCAGLFSYKPIAGLDVLMPELVVGVLVVVALDCEKELGGGSSCKSSFSGDSSVVVKVFVS